MRPLLLFILCCALQAGDPAMFRGGPRHLGTYAGPAPALEKVLWTFAAGGRVVGSPTLQDGVVYIGSSDGRLHALDARSGSPRWHFKTGAAVDSTPAVADGLVLFGSRDGRFYALEAATGTVKWTFSTEGERRFTAPGIHGATPRTERMPDPFDVFLSSPVVEAGRVHFGSGDGSVYALEAATGRLLWRFATGDVVHASPAVAEGRLYVGSWDRTFYALDAASGKVVWTYTTGADPDIHNQEGIASSAAVGEGMVFFGCRDGHFYALDAATGALRWRHDNRKGWVIASPALRDGKVLFPTSDGTRFKVLDARSGALLLSLENRAVSFSSPALAGRFAFYGTSDGWLHGVDLEAGRETCAFQTEGNRLNGPRWLDPAGKFKPGMYPEATLEGMFIGLDRMFSLGSVLTSPVIDGGTAYFGSTDGRVYAVR